MAERLRIAEAEARRGAAIALPPRSRLVPANDNVPPLRHIVGKLLVACASFGATFGFAWWWLA